MLAYPINHVQIALQPIQTQLNNDDYATTHSWRFSCSHIIMDKIDPVILLRIYHSPIKDEGKLLHKNGTYPKIQTVCIF